MSKISEKKALGAYPMNEYEFDKAKKSDIERKRFAYIKGYDQAIQDFLDKAKEFLYLQLNNGSIECGNIERLIEQFKNYIENES